MNTNMLSRNKLGFALSTFTFSFALSHGAAAQQECGDTTCDVGFECQTYTVGCPDILIACEDGEECGEPEPCEAQEEEYCERASCETDSDCGDIMVCGTFTEYCGESAPACKEGEDCDLPSEPPECDAAEYQQCAAPWELECSVDSDCGEGFTCKAQEICECSGSEGAASTDPAEPAVAGADSGAATSIAPDEGGGCSCSPGDSKYCEVVAVSCTSDDECPTNWTCAEVGRGLCVVDSEGNSDCRGDESNRMCQPPYDRVYATDGGIPIADIATLEVASASGPGAAVGADNGGAEPAPTSMQLSGGGENDTAGEAPSRASEPMASTAAGGCTLASPTSSRSGGSLPLASVIALGMLLGFRRVPRRS